MSTATRATVTDAEKLAAATRAISYVLARLQREPLVAYYFDPITESFEGLTHALALLTGEDVEVLRDRISKRMRFEAPALPSGGGQGSSDVNAALLAVARQVAVLGEYRDRVETMARCLPYWERCAFETLLRCDAPSAVAAATSAT